VEVEGFRPTPADLEYPGKLEAYWEAKRRGQEGGSQEGKEEGEEEGTAGKEGKGGAEAEEGMEALSSGGLVEGGRERRNTTRKEFRKQKRHKGGRDGRGRG
jgi:predicted transposase YdaD